MAFRQLVALLLSTVAASSAACAANTGTTASTEPAVPAERGAEAEDAAFGHALTLVQLFVQAASRSEDPRASAQAIDRMLAGGNPDANQAFSGLFQEATEGMSAQNKDRLAAIARDLAAMARKDAAKAASAPPPVSADAALQARKDLAAMGLRYYDEQQFLDAVRRDDALAVELFLAGRGVNPSSRDAQGRTALAIARANGNAQVAELLARNLPATR